MATISVRFSRGPNRNCSAWYAVVTSGAHCNSYDWISRHERFPSRAEAEAWAATEAKRQDVAQRNMDLFREPAL